MTDTPIHVLLYKSDAQTSLDGGADLDILSEAVALNAPNNITGFLVRYNSQFVQVLEGAKDVVEATYERILKDKRHSNCVLMWQTTADRRNFPKWAMSYAMISPNEDLNEILQMMAAPFVDSAQFDRCIAAFQQELSYLEKSGLIAH